MKTKEQIYNRIHQLNILIKENAQRDFVDLVIKQTEEIELLKWVLEEQ